MQRVVDGDIQAMVDRLRALSDRQAAEKAHRLSLLPPGTCEHCEGDGCSACTVPAQPCADGIPYEFQAASLKDEAREGQDRAILLARRFVEAPERDVYLYGGVGAGKTRLACAIANAWIVGRKRSALFARVPMLLYQLQPGRDQDSIDDLERRVLTRDLVVLDDIGAERDQATDFTRRTLLMLYEARCDAGKRTVFTSNKSLNELAQMQDDDRLSSRIAGRCDVVRVVTPDQRLRRVK